MIIGAHVIVYSRGSEADRAYFRDVLGFPHVDVGGGWLIFGLPPGEVAVHPTDGEGGTHELYLMTDDVEGFVADMRGRGVACGEITNQGWGRLTSVTLPGGSKLGVYEPRHASPPPASGGKGGAKKPAAEKPAAKKPAPKRHAAKKQPAKKQPAKKSVAGKRPGKRKR